MSLLLFCTGRGVEHSSPGTSHAGSFIGLSRASCHSFSVGVSPSTFFSAMVSLAILPARGISALVPVFSCSSSKLSWGLDSWHPVAPVPIVSSMFLVAPDHGCGCGSGLSVIRLFPGHPGGKPVSPLGFIGPSRPFLRVSCLKLTYINPQN